MFSFIRKIKKFRRKKQTNADGLSPCLQKDAGVRVTRIRLPSGEELVITHREGDDDSV